MVSCTGYATSGKDALADILVRNHGYIKVGWSDALCCLALSLNPRLGRLQTLASIVHREGWTEAKKRKAVRNFLQKLGTEGCRKCIGEDVWVNALMPKVRKLLRQGKNVVITNTRFPNEAQAVISAGGSLVKVSRPGIGPINNHSSDAGQAFEYATTEIENNGSLEDLALQAAGLHNGLLAAIGESHSYPINAHTAVEHLTRQVERAIALAVEAAISIAAPEEGEELEYCRRHRVHLTLKESGAEVYIDEKLAGVIDYDNGVLSMEAHIVRS